MKLQNDTKMLGAINNLNATERASRKSTEKLASGKKVNRAADDATALAISEKILKEVKGLSRASLNAQDGISAIQTAEGALSGVTDSLQRMNELAIQAGNGLLSADDRKAIQAEMDQLTEHINNVSKNTKFNETSLLDGSTNSIELQVGATGDKDNRLSVELQSVSSSGLGISGINITGNDGTNARNSIDVISAALNSVSTFRSNLGATQNRIEHTIAGNNNTIENTTAALSRMIDTNYAQESVRNASKNILAQANSAILAQANQNASRVLGLLA